jgi:hypothetical protein
VCKHEPEAASAPEAVGAEAAFVAGHDVVQTGGIGEQNEGGVGEIHRGVGVFLQQPRGGGELKRGEAIANIDWGVVAKSRGGLGAVGQAAEEGHRLGDDRFGGEQ